MSYKSKKNNIIVSLAIIIVVAFAIFLLKDFDFQKFDKFGDNTNEQYEAVEENFSENSYLYEDSDSPLSFNYPTEFSYYVVQNQIGYSIVVEDDDGSIGFQVNVLPWDEGEGRLTAERIRKDLPNLEMKGFDEVDIETGGGIIETVTFLTDGGDFGDLREVWFVKGEYLYQFVLPKDAEKLINMVFGTLSV